MANIVKHASGSVAALPSSTKTSSAFVAGFSSGLSCCMVTAPRAEQISEIRRLLSDKDRARVLAFHPKGRILRWSITAASRSGSVELLRARKHVTQRYCFAVLTRQLSLLISGEAGRARGVSNFLALCKGSFPCDFIEDSRWTLSLTAFLTSRGTRWLGGGCGVKAPRPAPAPATEALFQAPENPSRPGPSWPRKSWIFFSFARQRFTVASSQQVLPRGHFCQEPLPLGNLDCLW